MNEFKKYAVAHLGMSSATLDSFERQTPQAGMISPHVIEERQMRATVISVFDRLMMDRIIFLGTGVDDTVANIIQAQLLFLESADPDRDITMYINSPGGSVYAGLGIFDTMQLVKPNVATVCTGMAASMGAVLLAAGEKGKRSALKHSRIMIHQPLGGMRGQSTDMEIQMKEMQEVRADLYQILADATGKTFDEIFKDCDRDNWMRSQSALEYGLIDKIIERK